MCQICTSLKGTSDSAHTLMTEKLLELINPYRETFLNALEQLQSDQVARADALLRTCLFDVAVCYLRTAQADESELHIRLHNIFQPLAEPSPARTDLN